VRIEHTDDPRLAPFRELRDAAVAARFGVFIAEGRLVVPVLLSSASRFEVVSIVGTPVALDALELAAGADLARHADVPILELEQQEMDELVGFPIHRGLIAAGRRRGTPSVSDLVLAPPPGDGRLIVAVEDLSNHDNLGGVIRNAAAFMAGAVLTTPRCCDPLYRKCIRVSMGHALTTPLGVWSGGEAGVRELHELGYTTIALTPRADATPIAEVCRAIGEDAASAAAPLKLALLVGAEGPGLRDRAICAARYAARIPTAPGVDSLNTATATGIGLFEVAGLLDGMRGSGG
jgi:tRNA G18 (ribose-2'-O)-methylase SpoU